ncbi:protein FAM107B-like [Lissotriton helveticus]
MPTRAPVPISGCARAAALTSRHRCATLGGQEVVAQSRMGGFQSHAKKAESRNKKKAFISERSTSETGGDDFIRPRKLLNPVKDSRSHREMHRELLLTHRRGLTPELKPELQKVMETRKLSQRRKEEEDLRPKTDLEEQLRKRQQQLEQYEREQQLASQGTPATVPEFIQVKEGLKKVQLTGDREHHQT